MSGAFGSEAGWIKVESPHFKVISGTSERSTVAWAEEFSQFVGALQQFIPVDPKRLPPLTIVIFPNDRTFDRYRVVDAEGKTIAVDGFFSRSEDWAVAGLARASGSRVVQKVLFHEGVHWFLSAFSRRNPVWIEEGLAEVFSTFEVDRRNYSWGHAITRYLEVLDFERPMPLAQLMDQNPDFLIHEERETVGLVYVQSWAFMHFLLFGKHDLPRTAINDYLRLIQTMPPSEALFQQAFGVAYATVEQQFRAYLRGGTFFVGKQPLQPTPPLTVGPAEPIEVQIALGRLAIVSKRLDRAREHAEASVAVRPHDPRGYNLLGTFFDRAGDRKSALDAYLAAAARNSLEFRTYFQLGLEVEARTVTGRTAAQARTITQFYQKAVTVDPYQFESYNRLVSVAPELDELDPQDLEILRLGRKIFPADPELVFGLARLEERVGNGEGAASLVRPLLDEGNFSPEIRDRARLFLARWDVGQALASIAEFAGRHAFDQALAVAERALENENHPLRAELVELRKQLGSRRMIQRIRSAASAGDWAGARTLALEVLSGDFTADARMHANNQLATEAPNPVAPPPDISFPPRGPAPFGTSPNPFAP